MNQSDDESVEDSDGGALALIDEAGAAARQAGQPSLIVAGSFAIYANERGGLVLVTDIEGHGVQRKKIPSAFVRMAFRGPLGKLFRTANGGVPDGVDQ